MTQRLWTIDYLYIYFASSMHNLWRLIHILVIYTSEGPHVNMQRNP